MPGRRLKPRVLSGTQPTGMLHIGNYAGALSVWAAGQDDYENLFCVGDMYALKNPEAVRPAGLRDKTLEFAALYLACGKYVEIRDDAGYLDAVLAAGAEQAREIAEPRIKKIKEYVGFVPRK